MQNVFSNPKVCILLYSKSQDYGKAVDLMISEQNRLINIYKPTILHTKANDYYEKNEILEMEANPIPLVAKDYQSTIKKIKERAYRGSADDKSYVQRLENIEKVVEFFNLVKTNKYDKAFIEMKKLAFLPFKNSVEPELRTINDEILCNLPEVIYLACDVIHKKLKEIRNNTTGVSMTRYFSQENSEIENLKNSIDVLKTYFTRIEKDYNKRLPDSSKESMKKVLDVKELSKQISMMSFMHY